MPDVESMTSLERFRKRVVRDSLFSPRKLGDAIRRMGFVQADPIRSPARAQDLILRHRVKNYQVGDLERLYPKLGLEECFLFAYGFLSQDLWQVVHPLPSEALTTFEAEAFQLIERHGPMGSKELESHVGAKRARNGWGGYSRTAKLALETLHECGSLRVAHRKKGIRVYERSNAFEQRLTKEERFKEILVSTLRAMGATTRPFLVRELAHFDCLVEALGARRACLQSLLDEGRIRVDMIDSVEYISVEERKASRRRLDGVCILAPFDPIVRDRSRFEHLWGWTYRFEAYTPKAKRKLGYYAMPALWRDSIIGWANASIEGSRLNVAFGYANGRPREPAYREAAELEVARLARFLKLEGDCWSASI